MTDLRGDSMSEWYEEEIDGIRYRAIRKEPSDKSKKGGYYYSIADWFKANIQPIADKVNATGAIVRSIKGEQTSETITPKGFRRKKGEHRDSDRGWVE